MSDMLQQELIQQLQHRDRVVSLANETLARYVREGKEEISRLKQLVDQQQKYIGFLQSACRSRESWDGTITDFHERLGEGVNK